MSLLSKLPVTDNAVCVLAPVFTDMDADGYLRRIRAVDERVLSSLERIYMTGEAPGLRRERVRAMGNGTVFVEFDCGARLQRQRAFSLIRRCGRLYIHSAYRLFAGDGSEKLTDLLRLPDVRIVWDVHGAVPEETELCASPELVERAAAAEEALYRRSDALVSVSAAMEAHLEEKYGPCRAERFRLPLMEDSGRYAGGRKPLVNGRPAAIYAGGLQPWQNIPALLDLVSRTTELYDWRLFVPEPRALDVLWWDRPDRDKVRIDRKDPGEMGAEYDMAHYGLLLREDSPVNRVSCPTKLAEYILRGAMPVLRSARVGDLSALGTEYVTEGEFARGCIPTEKERAAMADRNLTRWREYLSESEKTAERLRGFITGERRRQD